jgi:hypothetical protein
MVLIAPERPESNLKLPQLQERTGRRTMSVDWTKVLEELRAQRAEWHGKDEELGGKFLEKVRVHFPSFFEQLTSYCTQLDLSQNQANVDRDKEYRKTLILETRMALRFGLACLSIEDKDVREAIQNEALACGWLVPLPRILSHSKGDSNCRLTAARLFSNLVTANPESAFAVVQKLPLSPSNEYISSRIRDSVSESNTSSPELESNISTEPNWTEMCLLSSRLGSRDTLAAVVAALHNCIVSLQDYPEQDGTGKHASFLGEIGSSRLLICTLLRQLVSIKTVNESLKEETEPGVDCKDSATEWISILLMKLCRMGMLPEIYQSAGGGELSGSVFPEQTVLLHCLREEVESIVEQHDTFDQSNPLGGEAGEGGCIASHLFLVQQTSRIRLAAATDNDDDDMHITLGKSALSTILDILAEVLGVDTKNAGLIRLRIAEETSLLRESALDLGRVNDHLSINNTGKKSREMTMLDEERQIVTVLVRLLGNLCFGCRQNQDLLRTTLVPSTHPDINIQAPERSALHVLLSCTSFSHTCFTLREWAVVAIRNVLDNNEANKAEVAKLEGQQPVQSAELNNMGIRVELDPRGKISVVPLDGIKEEKQTGDAK